MPEAEFRETFILPAARFESVQGRSTEALQLQWRERNALAGPYLTRLLGGSGPVGVVTFARCYGLHVLLPPLYLYRPILS